MGHGMPDVNPFIDSVPGREVPANVKTLGMALIGIGVLGFVGGFVVNPKWAVGGLLVAVIYSFALAQGGIMFSVMQTAVEARWARPLKRIAESFGFFFPVAYIGLAIALVLAVFVFPIYPWVEDPGMLAPHSAAATASKATWLNPVFFVVRQLGLFGLLGALNYMYLKASLGPDLLLAKQRLGDKTPAWWGRFLPAGTDVEAEAEAGGNRQYNLAFPIAILYGWIFSFMAFDLIMSLSPWWFSHMFGGWIFCSSFNLAMAMICFVTMASQDWLGLQTLVSKKTQYDLGNLMLAFTLVWAYMAYAQLMPIWYANMPEETDFIMVRLMLPEWGWLARTVGVVCFVVPFTILLNRGVKKMKVPFMAVASVLLVGLFLERTLLVMPSVLTDTNGAFPWVEFACGAAIWLGFIGGFMTVVSRALASMPTIPVSDRMLAPHPWDEHLHSLDAHHH